MNFQGRQHRSFAERPTATHAVNTETIANALKFHVKGMCIGSDSVRLQCNEHSNREQLHATLKVGVTHRIITTAVNIRPTQGQPAQQLDTCPLPKLSKDNIMQFGAQF